MNTTYDVRIWQIEPYKGQRGTTYKVVWIVAGRRWKETYKTVALAESFRSNLLAAARKHFLAAVELGRQSRELGARVEQDLSALDPADQGRRAETEAEGETGGARRPGFLTGGSLSGPPLPCRPSRTDP